MRSRLLALTFGCLLALGVLEIGLRVASVLTSRVASRVGRPSYLAHGARLLCVGDSNTYGVGVHPTESYPWHLEQLLNEPSGRKSYEVLNLGVPGMSSAQLLHRLRRWLALYRPQGVIVLVGANDFWNRAEIEAPGASLGERVHDLLMRLRIYRFVILSMHARRASSRPVVTRVPQRPDTPIDGDEWAMQDAGGDAIFRHPRRADVLQAAEHARLLRGHLEGIVRAAREAHVSLMLATYAAEEGPYRVANDVLRAVASVHGVPLADATGLWRFVPGGRQTAAEPGRFFYDDLHPRAALYPAFAANVREALLRAHIVPSEE